MVLSASTVISRVLRLSYFLPGHLSENGTPHSGINKIVFPSSCPLTARLKLPDCVNPRPSMVETVCVPLPG